MENRNGHEVLVGYNRTRKLEIEFSERYNRTPHADEGVEDSIERTWRARTAKNPWLFNGRKFRFGGIGLDGDVCRLKLGLTDYKTYIGTHSVGDALRMYGEGWLGQPLGNVVVPETSDGHTTLLVRSSQAGEGIGGVVFPGGHPEPDMIDDLQEGDARVEQELWEGARRELLEELWISDENVGSVGEMKFLGLVRRLADGKVSMVFSVKITLRGEQISNRFREKNDGVESDRMFLMGLDDMECVTKVTLNGLDIIAETNGAARLWMEMKALVRDET